MGRWLAVICTFAVGALITLQPPANASLASHVSDLGAAFLSLLLSFVIVGVLLVVVGDPSRLSGISSARPAHALGGIGGAAIVSVSLITVRSLGVAGVTAILVAAQLIVSVILDRLGIFGLHEVGISLGRVAGVGLIIAGTVLVVRM
jgi:transporter family-2 protein